MQSVKKLREFLTPYMLPAIAAAFSLLSGPLRAETDAVRAAEIHALLGWEDDLYSYHFIRAAEIIEKEADRRQADGGNLTDVAHLRDQAASWREGATAYRTLLVNQYPMTHFWLAAREVRSGQWPAAYLALRNANADLLPPLQQYSVGRGQIPLIVLVDRDLGGDLEHFATSSWQNTQPVTVFTRGDLDLHPLAPGSDLLGSQELFSNFLKKEGLEEALIIRYSAFGTTDQITAITAQVRRVSQDPGLQVIATDIGFGWDTRAISGQMRKTFLLSGLVWLFLVIGVLLIARQKDQLGWRHLVFGLIIATMLYALGLGVAPMADWGLGKLVENWKEPDTELPTLVRFTGALIGVAAALVGTFLTSKAQGISLSAQSKLVLPSILSCFGAGFGTWVLGAGLYFAHIFPGAISIGGIAQIASAAIAGLICLAFAARKIMRRTESLKAAVVVGGLLLVAGALLFSAATQGYLSANPNEIAASAIFAGLLVAGSALGNWRLRKRDLVSRAGTRGDRPGSYPLTPDDLLELAATGDPFKALSRATGPEFQESNPLSRLLSTDAFLENKRALESAIESMLNGNVTGHRSRQAGFILIKGPPQSGKSRLAFEVLRARMESGQLQVFCIDLRLEADAQFPGPFHAFLRGMQGVPEIDSLTSTLREGQKLHNISGDLADPVAQIPVVGALLSLLLRKDTSYEIARNDENTALHTLSRVILEVAGAQTRRLGDGAGIAFVLKAAQNILPHGAEKSRLLELLYRVQWTAEQMSGYNPISFVLLWDDSFSHPQLTNYLASEPIVQKPLSQDDMEILFFGMLGFSRKSQNILARLQERLGGTVPIGSLLGTAAALARRDMLSRASDGFLLKSGLSATYVPLNEEHVEEFARLSSRLSAEELHILQCGAVAADHTLGFDAGAIAAVTELSTVRIHASLRRVNEAAQDAIGVPLFLEPGQSHNTHTEYQFEKQYRRDAIVETLRIRAQHQDPHRSNLLRAYHRGLAAYLLKNHPSKVDRIAEHAHRCEPDPGDKMHAIAAESSLNAAVMLCTDANSLKRARYFLLRWIAYRRATPGQISQEDAFRALGALVQVFQADRSLLETEPDVHGLVESILALSNHANAAQYLNMAELAFLRAEPDECLRFAQQALPKASVTEMAWAFFWQASAFKAKGNPNAALERLQRAEETIVASDQDNLQLRGFICNTRGELLREHKAVEAIEAFEKGLPIKRIMGDDQGAAIAEYFLGTIHQNTGNIDAARRHLREALRLNRTAKSDFGVRRAATALADLEFNAGNRDVADNLARLAILVGLDSILEEWLQSPWTAGDQATRESSLKLNEWERGRLTKLSAGLHMKGVVKSAITERVRVCQEKASIPLWPEGPTGSAYLNGLVRFRRGQNRGSYIDGLDTWEKTRIFLLGLDFQEITATLPAPKPHCTYCQAELPAGYRGYQGVIAAGDARLQGLYVDRRKGDHGWELVAHTRSGLKPTRRVNVIIEDGILSTWYPGEIFPDTPRELPEDPALWDESWPVKLEPVPTGSQKSA